jgi:hypothetical protein
VEQKTIDLYLSRFPTMAKISNFRENVISETRKKDSGVTGLVLTALIASGEAGNPDVEQAIRQGIVFLLRSHEHSPYADPANDGHDPLTHAYVLRALLKARELPFMKFHAAEIDRVARTTVEKRFTDRRLSFAVADAIPVLTQTQTAGFSIEPRTLNEMGEALEKSRSPEGAFPYRLDHPRESQSDGPIGSIARTVACERALLDLGRSTPERLERALDLFFEHHEELEKVRSNSADHPEEAKALNHQGPYSIGPHYYFFGHYHAVQGCLAISDAEKRIRYLGMIRQTLLDIQNPDGSLACHDLNSSCQKPAFAILALRLCEPPPPPLQAPTSTAGVPLIAFASRRGNGTTTSTPYGKMKAK